MITFILTMAILVGIAALFSRDYGHSGSSNIVDRDSQRMQSDLSAILARSHHR